MAYFDTAIELLQPIYSAGEPTGRFRKHSTVNGREVSSSGAGGPVGDVSTGGQNRRFLVERMPAAAGTIWSVRIGDTDYEIEFISAVRDRIGVSLLSLFSNEPTGEAYHE